jgi:hypothetical protein
MQKKRTARRQKHRLGVENSIPKLVNIASIGEYPATCRASESFGVTHALAPPAAGGLAKSAVPCVKVMCLPSLTKAPGAISFVLDSLDNSDSRAISLPVEGCIPDAI